MDGLADVSKGWVSLPHVLKNAFIHTYLVRHFLDYSTMLHRHTIETWRHCIHWDKEDCSGFRQRA